MILLRSLTCKCFLHNVPLRLYWRVLLNYLYLFSDVMIILEYSHCISASCWLLVWRLHILAQIDNLIILVGALIFLLTLIAQCDSLLFSFRNLHLSWLSFGVVYCRTLRQLHITCRGCAWTICFSWYSWWYLPDIACKDLFDWSPLYWGPYLGSLFL